MPTCPVFTRAKIKSRLGILVNFASHKQRNNQRFNGYVMKQRQCASKCEFGDLYDSLIKDILIVSLIECLHREPDLTQRKSIQADQVAEEIKKVSEETCKFRLSRNEHFIHKT